MPAGAVSDVDEFVDAVDRGAERFLAAHVFARFHGPGGPGHVQVVGQRHVDGVDVRIGEQVLVAAIGAGNAEFSGTASALALSREAMARRLTVGACCIPGIVHSTAMAAAPSTPQFTTVLIADILSGSLSLFLGRHFWVVQRGASAATRAAWTDGRSGLSS